MGNFVEGLTAAQRERITSETINNLIGNVAWLLANSSQGGLPKDIITANSGSAYTIDVTDVVYFEITLTENCTFTFPTGLTSGELTQFWLYLKQDATGGRSVTWPASVKWAMDIVPALDTTLSTLTILHFQSLGSDSRWYGEVLGMGYAV